jgi:hypothetical protein
MYLRRPMKVLFADILRSQLAHRKFIQSRTTKFMLGCSMDAIKGPTVFVSA